MRSTPGVARILTGGQSGVDRAATDVAIHLGIPYGGAVPKGGFAEDLPVAPGVLARYPGFRELGSAVAADRTVANVADADAVLALTAGGASPGTDLAIAEAERRSLPIAVVELGAPGAEERVAAFLPALPPGSALNVVGPRESERPGSYLEARDLLLGCADLLAPRRGGPSGGR